MRLAPKYRAKNYISKNELEFEEISRLNPWRTKKTKLIIDNQSIKIINKLTSKILNTFELNILKYASIKLQKKSIRIQTDFPTEKDLIIVSNDEIEPIGKLFNRLINILNLERHKPISQFKSKNSQYHQNDIPDLYSNYHPKYKYILNYEKKGELIISSYSDLQIIKPNLRIDSSTGSVKQKKLIKSRTFEKNEIMDFAINTGTNHFRYIDNYINAVFGNLLLIDKLGEKHKILTIMGKSMEETSKINHNKEFEIEYELLRIREKIIRKIYST